METVEKPDLYKLDTEKRNKNSMNLDQMTPLEIAELMNHEDENVVRAVKEALPQIANAIELATGALKKGGRIIYIGAGTSGRLGVLDASECPPTFGVPQDMVIGVMAGGKRAVFEAVEGAEDNRSLAKEDLSGLKLNEKDLVIGLAASGRTPYVIGGIEYAHSIGCRTVSIACTKGSETGQIADIAIEVLTGPEVLTGSTRLKAGTAQKMILNMISTGSMAQTGRVYQNLMVDVQKTNDKLRVRAKNIIMEATGCAPDEAETALIESGGKVKTAIVMLILGISPDEAKKKIENSNGSVRDALL